ncbi:MAG: hypothetical protein AAB507_01655 [Patescibacteria group bacterium]
MITIDDFKKLDIRIGTILSAEIVPEADKLLKLVIDLGLKRSSQEDRSRDVRQIIAGIREYVGDPVRLVGLQVPVLANLTPRAIRGLESNGMILAGSADGAFALIHPEIKLPNGSEVR